MKRKKITKMKKKSTVSVTLKTVIELIYYFLKKKFVWGHPINLEV